MLTTWPPRMRIFAGAAVTGARECFEHRVLDPTSYYDPGCQGGAKKIGVVDVKRRWYGRE